MTEDLEIVEQGASPAEEVSTGESANDMLSKTTVSKIVERERQKAFEKGKQEALMQLQQEQQMQQPEAAPAPIPSSQSLVLPAYVPSRSRRGCTAVKRGKGRRR